MDPLGLPSFSVSHVKLGARVSWQLRSAICQTAGSTGIAPLKTNKQASKQPNKQTNNQRKVRFSGLLYINLQTCFFSERNFCQISFVVHLLHHVLQICIHWTSQNSAGGRKDCYQVPSQLHMKDLDIKLPCFFGWETKRSLVFFFRWWQEELPRLALVANMLFASSFIFLEQVNGTNSRRCRAHIFQD